MILLKKNVDDLFVISKTLTESLFKAHAKSIISTALA